MTTDGTPDAADQPAGRPDGPPRNGRAGLTSHDRPSAGPARRVTGWGKQKYAGSWAADLWHRLDAMDFMNQATSLAGTLLLCAFPFFLVLAALTGRSAVTGIARRLNLNQQAAADVGGLFTSSASTSAAVTGLAWAFFILCGIAAAASVQGLYERVFELHSRGTREMARQLIWLGLAVGYLSLAGWAGPWVHRGGPVLSGSPAW